jgi:hypothetical protein
MLVMLLYACNLAILVKSIEDIDVVPDPRSRTLFQNFKIHGMYSKSDKIS